jgi:DNA-binding transcriptional ArsR family regulator
MNNHNKQLEKMLAALAAENRLEILQLLRDQKLCVGALARHLNISQSAVSQHLRILKDASLLDSEKKGYFVHYTINESAFKTISAFAKGFINVKQTKCQSSKCERR